ncbi:MAG: outer membrane beta-barrel protein [Alphaproteobacteria bacterium]|nr:outer membrane beta-barrel protein [Alphaproteobacteria bacterium]
MRTPSLAVAVAVAGTIASSAWAGPRYYDMADALAAEHPFAHTGWGGMWPDVGPVRPTLPPEAGLRGYDIGPLLAAPHPFPGTAIPPVRPSRPTLPPGAGVGLYDMSPFLSQPHPFDAAGSAVSPYAPAPPAAPASVVPDRRQAARAVTPSPPPEVRRADPVPAIAQAPPAPPQGMPPRRGTPGMPVDRTPAGREASQRFYVGGVLGVVVVQDAGNSGVQLDIDAETEAGFHLAGTVGTRLENGLRLEFELAYRQAGVDTLDVTNAGSLGVAAGSRPGEGTLGAMAMMFNAAWEFDLDSRVRPFVLGGVGAARVAYSDVKAAGAATFDDSAIAFAWQLGVGATVAVSDRWLVDLSYRLFAVLEPEFADAAGEVFEGEFVTHDFLVGARYLF